MTISVASRKAKGRRLQQWVAKEISKITGLSLVLIVKLLRSIGFGPELVT